MVAQHVPPKQLYICEGCKTLILCGNQSLSSSKLNGLASEVDPWNLNTGASQNRLSSFRTGNISLSALLAHVGHAVNDFSLDQDFQLRIEPWGSSPDKRPEAFRVFLQLTDLVLVWYDVLVKDIFVWIVCKKHAMTRLLVRKSTSAWASTNVLFVADSTSDNYLETETCLPSTFALLNRNCVSDLN